MATDSSNLVILTSDIVSSYVASSTVRPSEIPDLIATVHASLLALAAPKPAEIAPDLKPAVPVKKSITEDYIICLNDGKKFKSLKRHLATLGMTPAEYRAKWGLPRDYPMVAPGYAAKRSELARATGLGTTRQKAPEPTPEPVREPAKKRGRGRPKAAGLAKAA